MTLGAALIAAVILFFLRKRWRKQPAAAESPHANELAEKRDVDQYTQAKSIGTTTDSSKRDTMASTEPSELGSGQVVEMDSTVGSRQQSLAAVRGQEVHELPAHGEQRLGRGEMQA